MESSLTRPPGVPEAVAGNLQSTASFSLAPPTLSAISISPIPIPPQLRYLRLVKLLLLLLPGIRHHGVQFLVDDVLPQVSLSVSLPASFGFADTLYSGKLVQIGMLVA